MKELLMEVVHYRRNLEAAKGMLAAGNSLCYEGERDGHWQIKETPLIEGNMPDLFETLPSKLAVGEISKKEHSR
jgi:hypothetical protein